MSRRLASAAVAGSLVAAIGLVGLAPMASGQSESIKLGGGFALTGDESVLDVPAANGAQMAVDEINAAGGVNGAQLDYVVHDSQYDMAVTAQTAKQFVEEDGVQAFIGYTDTDSVLASGKTFQNAGIPFITVGATSPKIPSQVGDLMFLACFGDNVQAAAGSDYALANFGSNAYLLWDKGIEYTTLLGAYFKAAFEASGGTIVLEDTYDDDATDFSAQITKITALETPPDFYYVAAMPYNVGPVVKQMRDAGITGPIVGGDGYDTPDLVAVAGDAANDTYFTTHALMDATIGTDGIKAFMAAYETRWGHPVENAFAALGYDTVYLMADALGRAESLDGAAIKAAIEATSGFPGITGAITFAPGVHVPQKGVTIIGVQDQLFTLADEVVPAAVPAP